MASLTEVLGAQSAPGVDVAGGMQKGLQTGIQLATAETQVQQQKLKLEEQKEQVEAMRFQKVSNMLDKISKASPDARGRIAKAYRGQLQQMGIPMSEATFEDLTKNQDMSNQIAELSRKGVLNALGKDPAAREEVFGALVGEMGFADAVKQAYQLSKEAEAAALAQKNSDLANRREDNRLMRENRKEDIAADKLDRADVSKLSERLAKDSIPEVVSAIETIDKQIGGIYQPTAAAKLDKISGLDGFAAGFKVPWTEVKPLENTALKGDDLKLYQSVGSLRNSYLKLRSGGAVSDTEAERFLQELGAGGIRTGEQLQNGIQALTKAMQTSVKNIEAGYSPDVIDRYKRQGGNISSDRIPTAPKAGGSAGAAAPKLTKAQFIAQAKASGVKKTDAELNAFADAKGLL